MSRSFKNISNGLRIVKGKPYPVVEMHDHREGSCNLPASRLDQYRDTYNDREWNYGEPPAPSCSYELKFSWGCFRYGGIPHSHACGLCGTGHKYKAPIRRRDRRIAKQLVRKLQRSLASGIEEESDEAAVAFYRH